MALSGARVVHMPLPVLAPEQGFEFAEYLVNDVSREFADSRSASCVPVEASYLVSQDSASNGKSIGKQNFEWISFDMTRDRA